MAQVLYNPDGSVRSVSGDTSTKLGKESLAAMNTPTTTPPATTSSTSPESEKLKSLGLTPDQINQLNNPAGLDPSSFTGLIGNVEQKLKLNNDLVTQRGYLMKHLFDSPLTFDEMSKLPEDVQRVVKSGDKNAVELQLRLTNDQISGRANTLTQSIKTLTDGYDAAQKAKQDAISNFVKFSQQFPNPGDAAKALEAVYGPDTLRQLGINVPELQGLTTTSGIRYGTSIGSVGITIPEGTIAAQTNNPLNIKYSATSTAGGVNSGIAAADGGTFASFTSPEEGLQAAINLLKSPTYNNLTVDQAMKLWSNDGYGANVSPSVNPNQLMSSVTNSQMQQLVGDMAKRESGTKISGGMSYDAAPPSSSDPLSNTLDANTGMTPNFIYQAALEYIYKGGNIQQFVGGLSSKTQATNAKQAIEGKAGAIASSLGVTLPQLQALYKANSAAATQNVERVARVESVAHTVTLQMPRLAKMADQVVADGIQLTESDIQAGSAAVLRKTGNVNASNYVELLSTIRGDYSAMIAALGGSRGGQFFSQNAIDAIPLGYTGEQYLGLGTTIEQSSQNAKTAIDGEVQSLIGASGNPSSPDTSSNNNDPLGIR